MITIDYALRVYTDMVNIEDNIDMAYFETNLSETDFQEFRELIPFITLIKSAKLNDEFQRIFSKVDKHKDSILNMPSAANFRAQRNSDNIGANSRLDQVFEEEFGDE